MNFDITNSIQAKSDQLNADDLVTAPRTIKISDITQGNAENPVIVHYEGDNGRPFKPCKTVLRIIGAGWGNMTGEWVGKSLVLYCDPTVVYGGKEVGGIRIQAMSNISKRLKISLSKTRGKKVEHLIDILAPVELQAYPAANFMTNFPKWEKAIENKKMTAEQIINGCNAKANLTDEQKQQIRDIEKGDADLMIDESVNDFFNDKEDK